MEPTPRLPYRPRTVWAWALYDFANSAFTTLVVTFVYATYFTKALVLDPATGLGDEIAGTALWSRGVTTTAVLVALLSPILGAYADRTGTRKRLMLFCTVVCIAATVGLFFPVPGQAVAALTLFIVANVAFELGAVFYNAFLPEIAPPDKIGRVSGWGWALGYGGGLVALVIALVVLIQPEVKPFGLDPETGAHVRATNLLVAAWFAVFSIPAFVLLHERRPAIRPAAGTVIRDTFAELRRTFGEIRRYRQVVRLLVARLVYNDGLNTVFAFGGIYAAGTFGFETAEIITFGIALNVAAGLGAFLFGFVDDRIGGKQTILISLVVLSIATAIAVWAPTRTWLWVGGMLIGIAAGPNQAASRSLVGRFAPPDKEAEIYGFFGLTGKLAAFLGPLALGVFTDAFESQRAGVATVLIFFVIGGLLLLRVNEREGVAASGRGTTPADCVMPTVAELTAALEAWAPPGQQADYDNAGLQVGDPARELTGVVVALDCTPAVVAEAAERGAELIVTHHPLLFRPLKRLTPETPVAALALSLASRGIALYAIHTNLDAAGPSAAGPGGVSFALAERLGLAGIRFLKPLDNTTRKLVTFVPLEATDAVRRALSEAGAGRIGAYEDVAFTSPGTGHFRPTERANPAIGTAGGPEERVEEVRIEVEVAQWDVPCVVAALRAAHPYEEVAYDVYPVEQPSRNAGFGAVGTLPEPLTLDAFLARVAERLNADALRFVGDPERPIRTVAVCGGAGADLLPEALRARADAYVTADVTYHRYFDALDAAGRPRLAYVDAGHYETEAHTEVLLADWLAHRFPDLRVARTQTRTSPVRTFTR